MVNHESSNTPKPNNVDVKTANNKIIMLVGFIFIELYMIFSMTIS